MSYIDLLPDCTNRDIIILDLTYNTDSMHYISTKAKSVTVIDNKLSSLKLKNDYNLLGSIDCAKSACILAWEYFHDDTPPLFFEYVQNREFWKFDLPYSKEVFVAIANYDLTFSNYTDLSHIFIDDLVIEGQAIVRKSENDIKNILKNCKNVMMADTKIRIVNSPYFYSSDCANILADEHGVGCSYYCSTNKVFFNLRSRIGSDIDVSKIASEYGGDGSKHAAGFIIVTDHDPIQKLLDCSKK